ncbi:MAG: NADH-quinone oxidoreductase subunit L [Candidatus Micrarchaeaceae archaeon]|jgi:NADH-quinone oxidoreductase subunit L
MLAILIIVPLIAAALLALLMRKLNSRLVGYVALTASIITLLLILGSFLNQSQVQSINWFSIGSYSLQISTSTAPLNMILLLLVGIMTPLIITYSIGFMHVRSEQSRYYFELCLFAAAMMLFAISADFITMFIAWELLGITSYLLIGFWYHNYGAAGAARKAITTILIGDMMMLAAILIIWSTYGTFSFSVILQQAGFHSAAMSAALTLIMFAAFTKSAQFPFHEWLPDAMKGPTPVSAFLHSSTMVKAGVFIVAVLLPLFAAYNMLHILLIFGIITAALGITNALAETNIKRVLAYSTLEDLGLMFVALGTGSLISAMLLLIVQTFYKALLFMSAGSIISVNGNEEDLRRLQNSAKYPSIFIPTVIAVASLAGIFPLSGFFGKAAVAASASASIPVYITLVIIAFASNIYIFRWLFMPLRRKNIASKTAQGLVHATIPRSMKISMYVLALLVLVGAIAYLYLPVYLLSYNPQPIIIGPVEVMISLALFAVALAIAYYAFYLKDYVIFPTGSLHKLLHNSEMTNDFYSYMARLCGIAGGVIESFDIAVYGFIKGAAHDVGSFAEMLKGIEDGSTRTYIAALVIGLAFILIIIIL